LRPPLLETEPGMRKRLHLALMISPVIATLLSVTTLPVRAADEKSGTPALMATTDENGHRVWVNESLTPAKSARPEQPRPSGQQLVFWSSTEHRYKPVPHASMQAARSAVAEVNRILEGAGATKSSTKAAVAISTANYQRGQFTPEQVDSAIEQAAARHNLDPNLVRAVIKVESNFNPNAVSRKGAMGLMQLMPTTARQLNVSNPFDPEQNVDAGVRHLKRLLESYGGDVNLTLAAYNAGAGAVARSAGIPHFAETRNYVKRITTLYYGGSTGMSIVGSPLRQPVRVQRDERGVLYISNTD
jgi:transglycosylase-like protein with SLT domain